MATVLIPEGISLEQAKEWMAVLQERMVNAKVNADPVVAAATAKAKTDVDDYRESIGLKPKYRPEKVAEPVEP